MATRALKKLTKRDDLKQMASNLNDSDEKSESDAEEQSSLVPQNKFDLLDLLESKEDKSEEEEEKKSDEEENETSKKPVTTTTKSRKAKQKGKKKDNALSGFKFVSSKVKEEDEEEDEKSSNTATSAAHKSASQYKKNERIEACLQIEPKNLNTDNEMSRIFGSRVVKAERNDRRNRRPTLINRKTLVTRKPTWPEYRRQGLSMKILKESSPEDIVTEFAFEHDPEYQKFQFMFLDAIERYDHNFIVNVIHLNPYHIDSLIQLSEVVRHHDDTQMAAELIERALFAFQQTFHSAFNLSKLRAGLYKLDYNRVENRGLFIALFKQIVYVGSKACYRTSLELSKLLLSLDLHADPLAVILLVDFYAIRSSQFQFLVEFDECFRASKHLELMPNMCLSLALAYANLHRSASKAKSGEDGEKWRVRADQQLRDALLKFPAVLLPLLDKCGVMPDKKVESSSIFSKVSHLKTPTGLKCLLDLYVERMHHEWKLPENLEWLELTVREIVENEKTWLGQVDESKKKWQSMFAKVPPNVYRHLILSDLKEVPPNLPPSYPSTATYVFNPAPPKNSIISYTRPERRVNQGGAGAAANELGANSFLNFFESLLPTFNLPQEGAAAGNNNNRQARGEGRVAAGAEGGAGEGLNLHLMMDRLRDFLQNVNLQFPAAAAEGAARDEDNNDDFDTDEDDDDVEDNVIRDIEELD